MGVTAISTRMYIAALSHTSLRDRAVTSSVVEYCTECLRNARLDPVVVAIPDDTTYPSTYRGQDSREKCLCTESWPARVLPITL